MARPRPHGVWRQGVTSYSILVDPEDGTPYRAGSSGAPATIDLTGLATEVTLGELLTAIGALPTTTPADPPDFPYPVTDNDGSLTVDGEVTVDQSGVIAAVEDVTAALGETLSVTIPTPVPVTDNGSSLTVDGEVTVPGVATATGQANIVDAIEALDLSVNIDSPLPVSQSGAWNVTVGDGSGPLTVDGTVAATQSGTWSVNAIPTPSASATGLSVFRSAALSNTATAIKGSAGRVHGYHLGNPNTAPVYVHLYNVAAASVTVGTTTPLLTLFVPTGSAIDGAWPMSPAFSTAISIACTTTATGSTAPGTPIVANVMYV